MPESFIPVWMSIGEAEQFRETLGELEESEAGLPERELSLIEGALEREKPRSFGQMQAEQGLSEGTGEAPIQRSARPYVLRCDTAEHLCRDRRYSTLQNALAAANTAEGEGCKPLVAHVPDADTYELIFDHGNPAIGRERRQELVALDVASATTQKPEDEEDGPK